MILGLPLLRTPEFGMFPFTAPRHERVLRLVALPVLETPGRQLLAVLAHDPTRRALRTMSW
jgi:hypothetical protein